MPAPLPLKIRRLRASMEMKGLSLSDIAAGVDMPYAVASRLLNARPESAARTARLKDIAAFIKAAPMPEEVAR